MSPVTARDIAAVVVLYRPERGASDNIASYIGQVDRVYAIDNTETPDTAFAASLARYETLEYVPLGDNLGIAAALNAGIERAKAAGYPWVLTLDQDSTPTEDMVTQLTTCANERPATPPTGVIGAVMLRDLWPTPDPTRGCTDALTVITSGNLLSVDAWDAVGRFDESLFIDQVDHDLCMRLHRHGFAVVKNHAAWLKHNVGAPTVHGGSSRRRVSNHSPLRRYYIMRNKLIVIERYGRDYPEFRKREIRSALRAVRGIVLYEDRKAAKLMMMWRGYRDYRRGITGPYQA